MGGAQLAVLSLLTAGTRRAVQPPHGSGTSPGRTDSSPHTAATAESNHFHLRLEQITLCKITACLRPNPNLCRFANFRHYSESLRSLLHCSGQICIPRRRAESNSDQTISRENFQYFCSRAAGTAEIVRAVWEGSRHSR